MRRGLPTCEVTFPKLPEPSPVLGGPNVGWLNRLKNSVRNSRPSLSSGPKFVLLKAAKSKLTIPSCRSEESTRDSFPYPHCGGAVKQAVLNHSLNLALWPPEGAALSQPGATLGRTFAIPNPAFSSAVWGPAQLIFSGNPFWNVVTPSMPQPDTTFPVTPLASDMNLLPR